MHQCIVFTPVFTNAAILEELYKDIISPISEFDLKRLPTRSKIMLIVDINSVFPFHQVEKLFNLVW